MSSILNIFFSQFLSIVTCFLAVSLCLEDKKVYPYISASGYLLFSISFLIFLELFLFAIDGVNDNIIILKRTAEDLPIIDDESKERVKQLLRDIEDLKPLSGYGLFSVNRSTLTNMTSVSITYLIVLVQFKQNSM